jgi:limonene-1,2-epoxide hydrolase
MNAEAVVRAELEAWSSLDVDQIMAYFAPDATWLPGFTYPTSSGYEEVRRAVEGFLTGMTRCDIEIVNLAVARNVVLTERVDRLILLDGKKLDAPGMGTFEVTGDKITAWRDYFYAGAHD